MHKSIPGVDKTSIEPKYGVRVREGEDNSICVGTFLLPKYASDPVGTGYWLVQVQYSTEYSGFRLGAER